MDFEFIPRRIAAKLYHGGTMNLTTERQAALAAGPIFGGTAPNPQAGILVQGSALVTHTADLVDLGALWNELNDAFTLANEHRTNIAKLLSWATTDTATVVPQNINPPEFELASELGVPKAVGMRADTLLMGYMLHDYDVSHRTSWRFLRAASADQVRTLMNSVIEADDRLVNQEWAWGIVGVLASNIGYHAIPAQIITVEDDGNRTVKESYMLPQGLAVNIKDLRPMYERALAT
jgi:hypothetical protein